MEYETGQDRTYVKVDETKVETGRRADGGRIGDRNYSVIEASRDEIKNEPGLSLTAGEEARVHALRIDGENGKVNARFLGADLGYKAGIDPKCVDKEDHVFGGEIKARATAVEVKHGPANIHLGAGVSTGAKIEDGTADLKLAGCGFKVGKKIGISFFDNEISFKLW